MNDDLDERLAEHCMGWIKKQGAPEGKFCREWGEKTGNPLDGPWWQKPDGETVCALCEGVPNFQDDPTAAVALIEETANSKGWLWTVSYHPKTKTWFVGLDAPEFNGTSNQSFPLAVALAADEATRAEPKTGGTL